LKWKILQNLENETEINDASINQSFILLPLCFLNF